MSAVLKETEATLHLFGQALLAPVVIRTRAVNGTLAFEDGLIIGINVEDGTIDAQTDEGVARHVPCFLYETRFEKTTWHWPNAGEPEDPANFKADR